MSWASAKLFSTLIFAVLPLSEDFSPEIPLVQTWWAILCLLRHPSPRVLPRACERPPPSPVPPTYARCALWPSFPHVQSLTASRPAKDLLSGISHRPTARRPAPRHLGDRCAGDEPARWIGAHHPRRNRSLDRGGGRQRR